MRVLTKASGAVLAPALLLAACGGSSAADKVACKNTKRIEAKTLLASPPSGYKVDDVPQGEADEILTQFPKETREEISGATAVTATKGKSVAVVYALTSAKERLDPQDELKGFRESAEGEVEELEVAGETGALQTIPDGTVAVGTAGDCGAVLIIGPEEEPVREVAGALEAPKT